MLQSCNNKNSNNFLGKWCYSDSVTDFTIQVYESNDSLLIRYSYIMNGGNRINETINGFSGFSKEIDLSRNQIIIRVIDEYQKEIIANSDTGYSYNIQLLYTAKESTLIWQNLSLDKPPYLPDSVKLKHCLN